MKACSYGFGKPIATLVWSATVRLQIATVAALIPSYILRRLRFGVLVTLSVLHLLLRIQA